MLTPVEIKLREIMAKNKNIRNIAILGAKGSGKTQLMKSLAKSAIIRSDHTESIHLASYEQLKKNQSDQYPSNVTYCYETSSLLLQSVSDGRSTDMDGYKLLVNLLDWNDDDDLRPDSLNSLKMMDSALLVIDCTKNLALSFPKILTQALVQRLRPIFFFNKLDLAIFDSKFCSERLYEQIEKNINEINDIISSILGTDSPMGNIFADPLDDTVVFGSALLNWAFNISTMSRICAEYLSTPDQTQEQLKESIFFLSQRLWGNWFFNSKTKIWSTEKKKGFKRAFSVLIIERLKKVEKLFKGKNLDKCLHNRKKCFMNADRLNEIYMFLKSGEQLMNLISNLIPLEEILLPIFVQKLPNPSKAQKYRMNILYDGLRDDEAILALQNCDHDGPLIMCVTKLMLGSDKKTFYAYGRVFSGKAEKNTRVKMISDAPTCGTACSECTEMLENVCIKINGEYVTVLDVPCGNFCFLADIDKYIFRSATITTLQDMRHMNMSAAVHAVVICSSVKPVFHQNLPMLIEGLFRLSKIDPLIECSCEENGNRIISCTGERHLEFALNQLNLLSNISIEKSKPFVKYRETVSTTSYHLCFLKSQNPKITLSIKAEPIPIGLPEAIEQEKVFSTQFSKNSAKYLCDHFGFTSKEVENIVVFGPDILGTNIIFKKTSNNITNFEIIKPYITSTFRASTSRGPLCGERMRGVRFDLHDAAICENHHIEESELLFSDMKKLIDTSVLTAKPRLLEPIYAVEVACLKKYTKVIKTLLLQSKGTIESKKLVNKFTTIIGCIPVLESFDFMKKVSQKTNDNVHPQFIFDYWKIIPGNPFETYSLPGNIVQEICQRKGLKVPSQPNEKLL